MSSKKKTGAKKSLSGALKALLQRPGALGGRGARTAMIENYLASMGRTGATVSEIETALNAPAVLATDVVQSMRMQRVAAVRPHIATLYARKNLLTRDEQGRYFIASLVKSKRPAKKTGAKKTKRPSVKSDAGAETVAS